MTLCPSLYLRIQDWQKHALEQVGNISTEIDMQWGEAEVSRWTVAHITWSDAQDVGNNLRNISNYYTFFAISIIAVRACEQLKQKT